MEVPDEALDPNTPPYRLAELLEQGDIDAVLKNPALPLILLEEIEWLHYFSQEALFSVLQRADVPKYLLSLLIEHPQSEIRRNAQMHVGWGEEVKDWAPLLRNLAALQKDGYEGIFLHSYKMIPGWLEAYLSVPFAQRRRTHERQGSAMSLTRKDHVVKKRVRFSIVPEATLRKISGLSSDRRMQIASHTEHLRITQMLLEDRDYVVSLCAEKNMAFLKIVNEVLYESTGESGEFSGVYTSSEVVLKWLFKAKNKVNFSLILDVMSGKCECTPEIRHRLQQLGCEQKRVARFLSIADLEALFRGGKSWAADEAIKRDNAPSWLVAEAILKNSCLSREYKEQIYPDRSYLKWFCALLITENIEHLSGATRSGNWFMRFGAVIHPRTPLPLIAKRVRDPNRYVRFAAKARLRDTTWVFPPAACGGQGEKS